MTGDSIELEALRVGAAARPLTLASLRVARAMIDQVDDALVVLFALRRRLVQVVAERKRRAGLPMRDPVREARVRARARYLAERVALPRDTSRRLCDLLIDDACELQGLGLVRARQTITDDPSDEVNSYAMTPMSAAIEHHRHRLLRLVPPPWRWAPLLRLLPQELSARMFATAMTHALTQPLASGVLDFMDERRLGIAASDLGLEWVVELRDGQLRVCAPGIPAEATVSGSVTDLLLLASRLEDADTLFFQRRLKLTGDTELGLTARNVLDRLPWETVPLPLRIAMHRGARLAAAARAAHQGETTPESR